MIMRFFRTTTIHPETAVDRFVNHIMEELNQQNKMTTIMFGDKIHINLVVSDYISFSSADRNYINRRLSTALNRDVCANYTGSFIYVRVW
jgi:hypothetical protein